MNKFLDQNGLLYFWQKIKVLLENKVDKATGKGLSANDLTDVIKANIESNTSARHSHANASALAGTTESYTTTEKNKLSGLSNYSLPTASATILGGIKVGTNLSIANGVLAATDTTYSAATATAAGLMSAAAFSKLSAFSAASAYALKTDLTGLYKYKGSVATFSALPSTGQGAGDTYNVEVDGQNYAWDGKKWDSLGGAFSIDSILNSEIDAIMAS